MLSGITKMLKKVLGYKAKRDVKEIEPIVKEINKQFDSLQGISNDALRNETVSFKKEIHDFLEADEKEISDLTNKIENDTTLSIENKEAIYDQIDKLKENLDDKIEEVLGKILPRAFAVVKETAKRFTENTEIVVSATDFDRDLAARKAHISIEDDKAIWKNSWIAGGGEIEWNMIHYDVQLIGGIALHRGKIAEMQTGEGKTLVSTLPVYLNALAGKGVHLVTVNDYLARRDAEWMLSLIHI